MSESPAPISSSAEMPKGYVPLDHEARIRARWEQSNAWTANPQAVLSGQRKAFPILIPPPNVAATPSTTPFRTSSRAPTA